jgi:hypothetical protein
MIFGYENKRQNDILANISTLIFLLRIELCHQKKKDALYRNE